MKNLISFYKDKLEIDFSDSEHPIVLRTLAAFEEEGLNQEVATAHLNFLAESFVTIKNYDESIFDYYLKKIKNNKDLAVLGFVSEVNQCAHIIKKSIEEKLEFKFGDQNKGEPDFIVNGIGIEVTSCWFSDKPLKTNPGEKLLNKFNDKNKKVYAGNDCLLIIDISHISHYAIQNGLNIDKSWDEVRQIMKKDSKFGLIICLNEWIEVTKQKISFKSTAYQIYNDNCCNNLKELVEDKFIKGQKNEFENKPITSPY